MHYVVTSAQTEHFIPLSTRAVSFAVAVGAAVGAVPTKAMWPRNVI